VSIRIRDLAITANQATIADSNRLGSTKNGDGVEPDIVANYDAGTWRIGSHYRLRKYIKGISPGHAHGMKPFSNID
jgi:hypothetical protein